ncbi:ABC transporter permease [Jeongeupia naejangsanensis]|uniref:ABC transporter permease n=1 Tax=Jeongeupia naejangsanensis TaxID=613195 RepID=A0ABS2BHL3_9NEIS|nr:ABC transporter permease [Jeongeupia naejangsanensis]MBM3114578.1 ABC transporter permease [Jeongeupia naejangsanensis]
MSLFAERLRKGKPLVLPLLLLVLWQWLSGQGPAYAMVFVPAGQMLAGIDELLSSGELGHALAASVSRMSLGLAIGAGSGFALAVATASLRPLDRALTPVLNAVRQVPLLGWAPLLGLWLGNGEPAKLFVIAMAAFFPTLLGTYEGLRGVDRRYRELAAISKLSPWQGFVQVSLPAASPNVLTGVSQSLAVAWMAAVGTELLFAAGLGLGTLMFTAETGARMDVVLVCVAVIGVLGYTLSRLFEWLAHWLLRWRDAVST